MNGDTHGGERRSADGRGRKRWEAAILAGGAQENPRRVTLRKAPNPVTVEGSECELNSGRVNDYPGLAARMKNLPVQWSEGMFLRPHHMQAADRYWNEWLEISNGWDHPYNYGLQSIALSKEAIANYQVELTQCHARLRDGTLITIAPGEEPERKDLEGGIEEVATGVVSLAEAFLKDPTVRVYLGIPKLKLGRANVSVQQRGSQSRYVEAKRDLPDEVGGGNDQEISLRELNTRILLSTEDLGGYEIIPIAQIKRAGDKEATPQLDEDYIPPVVAVEAWPPLATDYVRAIYDIIGQKVRVLSEQVMSRGITPTSQEPGDMDRMIMLMMLNEAYATLRCLAFSKGLHPFVVYAELCRVVGKLSIFSEDRRCGEIPTYDHDDLARIFKWVKQQITLLIHRIQDYAYEREDFFGVENRMQVRLKEKWLGPNWDWYVGVNYGNATKAECMRLLKPGQLDWKMGCMEKVEEIFKNRAPGVVLSEAMTPPRALPVRGPWVFYQVTRSGAAWKDVENSKTLAMRFSTTLIKNLSELPGQKKLVVQEKGKPQDVTLEFTLFALDLRNV